MSYVKSPIDHFFFNLYGFYPRKAGQAYELLVNGALKLLNSESKVFYDKQVEGTYSKQKYQIDGVVGNEKTVEVKDYSLRDDKVGRVDVQKQEGGLIDLPHNEGIFASATGYTKPAKLYAKGTIKNPVTKKIELFNIRPSTDEDEEGRVKTIILEMHIKSLNLETAKYSPEISEDELKRLSTMFPKCTFKIAIEAIYNPDGTIFKSIKDWTMSLSSEFTLDDNKTEIVGRTDFSGKCIKINGEFIAISGMKYKIQINKMTEVITIKQDGKACLFIRNEDDTTDTLLTDVQMRNLVFENGEVKMQT